MPPSPSSPALHVVASPGRDSVFTGKVLTAGVVTGAGGPGAWWVRKSDGSVVKMTATDVERVAA